MHDFLDMPKFCGKKGSELDDLGDKSLELIRVKHGMAWMTLAWGHASFAGKKELT